MPARTDILLQSDGDLPIGAALMFTGASDLNHQKDMFSSLAGEWKQFTQNGVGVPRYLKAGSNAVPKIKNSGRQQLERDGYTVGVMQITFNSSGKMLIVTNTSR